MSARTEQLVEEITGLEKLIVEARAAGSRDLVTLQEQLIQLQKQLVTASSALNEGVKTLLKG